MATFDSTLGAPGTTGWVLPTSAQSNPTWTAPAESAYGASTASQVSFQTYEPTNAGIIQDISAATVENGATKCFVSSGLGTLTVADASANYNVTISDNQTLEQVSLAYDNILDYTLSPVDSATFLNNFIATGFKLSLPTGVNTQYDAGARIVFTGTPSLESLQLLSQIVNGAVDASGDTAALFLADTLNAVLAGISTSSFQTEYLSSVNTVAVDLRNEDIALGIDVSSSVVTLDTGTSVLTIATTCYSDTHSNSLVNQVDSAHINAYQSTTTNGMTIQAFPGLTGDQFVFGLKSTAPQVRFTYNKATSSAPNDLASLDLPFGEVTASDAGNYSIRDNNWVLAFRVTLGDVENSQGGYVPPANMNLTVPGLAAAQ